MAYNMLIVDDSEVVRKVVRKTLGMTNVELGTVFDAANGLEALELLDKEWIDIVFADLNMPVMTGMELVSRMSESGVLDKIPVVIISTERSVTRIEELKAKGISAFVRKPFSPENLKYVIEELLTPGSDSKAGRGVGPGGMDAPSGEGDTYES